MLRSHLPELGGVRYRLTEAGGQCTECARRFWLPETNTAVEAICFTHNGAVWTAEVGRALRVQRYSRKPREAKYGVMQSEHVTRDVVAAIVPGRPTWLVHLDPKQDTHYWVNPFNVGPHDLRWVRYEDGSVEHGPL